MTAASVPAVLHQFQYWPDDEKVRWALDWKGLPHRRRSYLPGLHALALQRLSGQTSPPVLVLRDRVLVRTSDILEALEIDVPEPPLLPESLELRSRARAIQDRFDAQVAPAVRILLLAVLRDEPRYLGALFSEGRSAPVRWLYRAVLPVVRGRILPLAEAGDPRAREHAFDRVQRALEFVAQESRQGGFLVGERFGVADLCCAALLAPLAGVDHPDMTPPGPPPPRMLALLDRFGSHPGIEWVRAQYRANRPARVTLGPDPAP